MSHDTKHAIVSFAENRGVDTILTERDPLRLRSRVAGDLVDWVVRHALCDVVLMDDLGYNAPEHIALSGDGGPYVPCVIGLGESRQRWDAVAVVSVPDSWHNRVCTDNGRLQLRAILDAACPGRSRPDQGRWRPGVEPGTTDPTGARSPNANRTIR